MNYLPMRAADWVESKVRFPLWWMPKIDGVRGLNMNGALTARTLKKHANKYTTKLYSDMSFKGLDGELAANSETHPALCRLTASALGTIEGEPFTLWWVFDYITRDTKDLRYADRYKKMVEHVNYMQSNSHVVPGWGHVRVVPYILVHNLEQLNALDEQALKDGYEGSIIRDPNGAHKEGRSTVREGGLLRIKRFVDDEAIVVSIKEGQSNQNEATIDKLGKTHRSTHSENMVPNGQVGTLICQHKTDGLINVSPGEMDIPTRILYFNNQELIVGKEITFKKFPKGVKDKPRFPTFKCIRESGT